MRGPGALDSSTDAGWKFWVTCLRGLALAEDRVRKTRRRYRVDSPLGREKVKNV